MIVGIGVDLVDIARFERTLERTPRLRDRLFSRAEQTRSPRSLAARYAAKEALIKALGGSDGVHWTEIEITPEPSGRPWFTLTGSTAEAVAAQGITSLHLSMSHDAGFATAYVVAEADAAASAPPASSASAAASGAGAGARVFGARAATRGPSSDTGRETGHVPGATGDQPRSTNDVPGATGDQPRATNDAPGATGSHA